ncbi:MAG: ABC transporter ATP-binding protein [Lactovum sp.]
MENKSELISLCNVTKTFKLADEELTILDKVSLEIKKGEFIAVLGQSGSGKSTLANLIGFLDKQFTGTYFFQGKKVADYSDSELSKIRNEHVGFVFQNFHLIESMTVAENINLPLMYAGIKDKKRVEKVLEQVGLQDFINQSVKLLSGGQRQRVAIARALINEPSFLIADEPTGALDSKTSLEIMELFSNLHQKGATIILITHDEKLTSYCDKIIRVTDGRVVNL